MVETVERIVHCKKHSRYKGKTMPTKTNCPGCWIVWVFCSHYDQARKFVYVEEKRVEERSEK